jgi:hypothetical protein
MSMLYKMGTSYVDATRISDSSSESTGMMVDVVAGPVTLCATGGF